MEIVGKDADHIVLEYENAGIVGITVVGYTVEIFTDEKEFEKHLNGMRTANWSFTTQYHTDIGVSVIKFI